MTLDPTTPADPSSRSEPQRDRLTGERSAVSPTQKVDFLTMQQELFPIRDHWVLLLVLGIGLAVLGTFAFICSFVATLATVAIFGTLLFVGGIMELVNAITCRSWRGFFVHLLTGVLSAVVGLIMMDRPMAAAAGMTLLLAAAFMAGGILRIVVAAVEHMHGWGWLMVNGFVSLFLGIFIWRHFPVDAFWLIGCFIGIDLIFAGWAWIFLAIGIRNAYPAKS
jgi:uncharacterized membrane protein HdeD (DUF308 family)